MKSLDIALLPPQVPYMGPEEDNFLGSGTAGAGGNTSGVWNYLIGPAYTSDNRIDREELSVIIDGAETALRPKMHRARGTGMFYGIQEVDGLTVYLIDFTNMCEPWVCRLIAVVNPSSGKTRQVSFKAFLSPLREMDVPFRSHGASCFSIDRGTAVKISQNGADCAVVAFDDISSNACANGDGSALFTRVFSTAPGESCSSALYHYMHEAGSSDVDYVRSIRQRDAATDLESCARQWDQWLAEGIPLDFITDRKARDIVEANLINIKMQQGTDGGIMATPRTYDLCYVRDTYAALRGLGAAGHAAEARLFIEKMESVYQRLRREGRFGIPTAFIIGTDSAFISTHFGIGFDHVFMGVYDTEENWIAETPALYILIAADYYKATGDLETLKRARESIRYAMDIQLKFAEGHGWRLLFNGDETESAGSGIPVTERPGKLEWSMPSLAFCTASLEFYIQYLELTGDTEAVVEYRQKLMFLKASLDRSFWREDLRIHDWYRGANGEWPNVRLINYHLMLMYYNIPLNFPSRAVDNVLAMKGFLNGRGFLPNQPGGLNEDFCGHNLGYLLYDLAVIEDPMKERAYESIMNGGLTGCWGTWSEAYHADGRVYSETWDGRIHNLRPFESGINIDAVLKYWKTR